MWSFTVSGVSGAPQGPSGQGVSEAELLVRAGAELELGIAALPAGLLQWVCIPVPPPLLSMHCVLHVERGESPLLLCFEYFPPKCSLFSAGKGKNLCCPGSLFLSELLLTTSS